MPLNANDILSRYSNSGNIPILKSDFTGLSNDIINLNSDIAIIEPTGVVSDYIGNSTTAGTAPSGWVYASGRTIGNGSSSATERANADTENLFLLLWNSMADAQAPVSGGRGANAAADFAANKRITLPDLRGYVVAGFDYNNGSGTANRLTSALTGTTNGAVGGSQSHTLGISEIPTHDHNYDKTVTPTGVVATGSQADLINGTGGTTTNANHTHTLSFTTAASASAGSNSSHNNTQPTYILNKIIKL